MRIAIIEGDSDYREAIKDKVKETEWDVDLFVSASDFGRSSLSKYDVIIASFNLPAVNGRDLIKGVASKTTAQMFLMGYPSDNFHNEEDLNNERIKGLIDKSDLNNIISELKYIDSKLKLKSLMEKERNKLISIFPTNGFKIENKDGIAIIHIHELLRQPSKEKLLKNLDESGINKVVLSFELTGTVSSPYLGLIIFLYKEMKQRNGSLVFWDAHNDKILVEQLHLCNLSLMVPIYAQLSKAIEHLKKAETDPAPANKI